MELNKRMNDVVQIQVIEKDRDDRIKILRDESDKLRDKIASIAHIEDDFKVKNDKLQQKYD